MDDSRKVKLKNIAKSIGSSAALTAAGILSVAFSIAVFTFAAVKVHEATTDLTAEPVPMAQKRGEDCSGFQQEVKIAKGCTKGARFISPDTPMWTPPHR